MKVMKKVTKNKAMELQTKGARIKRTKNSWYILG